MDKAKRKLNKHDAHVMREAVAMVIAGQPLREVGHIKGIPHQTLHRYVKKQKEAPEPISMVPKYDVRRIFTKQQEDVLANYMITCAKMFYGLPLIECRQLAYEMASVNEIDMPDTWKIRRLAGEKWMRGFMKRNPRLSLRTPEGCSLARAAAFNETNVNLFFDKLHTCYMRSEHFSNGTRVFNLDETATITQQKHHIKILAERGSKQVSKITFGENGTLVTTCMIVSAAGNWLPPAMVFPRVNFHSRMINGAPRGTLGLAAKTGWMNTDLFIDVMKHFIKCSGSSQANPSILIYDNHESHISIHCIELAKENGVRLPHSTHKLQPLDVGIFGPFQKFYNAAVDSWMLHNPGHSFSIYEVAACVGQAREKVMTPATITHAFKKTELCHMIETFLLKMTS